MNSKIVFLFIALYLCRIPLYSQDRKPCLCDSLNSELWETKLTGDVFQISKIGEGSQFFLDEWLMGDIRMTNNMVVHDKHMNYNGFIDELIFLESNSFTRVKVDKELISGFCLKDEKSNAVYYFNKIPVKKDFKADSILIFGQVLYANKLSLYAYRRVVSGIPKQETEGATLFYRDVYEKSPLFYFLLPNGKTIGFKRINRRSLIALFPEKAEPIKKALKERKQRKFKTEADLIRVTEILNSITL
jgi:hypothetical protein